MSDFTNYAELAVGDHLLLNTSMTSPTAIYMSLHTASPTETGEVGELPVANGYAREVISFGAGTDGVYLNDTAITFTATGASWGNITHFAIWDASSAGNSLFWSVLDDTSKIIGDGDSADFAIGILSVTLA